MGGATPLLKEVCSLISINDFCDLEFSATYDEQSITFFALPTDIVASLVRPRRYRQMHLLENLGRELLENGYA